jgi:hypothetical protein
VKVPLSTFADIFSLLGTVDKDSETWLNGWLGGQGIMKSRNVPVTFLQKAGFKGKADGQYVERCR